MNPRHVSCDSLVVALLRGNGIDADIKKGGC